MKIAAEHRNIITAAVQRADTPERRAIALRRSHTNKRYRWDCLWAAGLTTYICDVIYPLGCNDDHIDTVLRHAVPPLFPVSP